MHAKAHLGDALRQAAAGALAALAGAVVVAAVAAVAGQRHEQARRGLGRRRRQQRGAARDGRLRTSEQRHRARARSRRSQLVSAAPTLDSRGETKARTRRRRTCAAALAERSMCTVSSRSSGTSSPLAEGSPAIDACSGGSKEDASEGLRFPTRSQRHCASVRCCTAGAARRTQGDLIDELWESLDSSHLGVLGIRDEPRRLQNSQTRASSLPHTSAGARSAPGSRSVPPHL